MRKEFKLTQEQLDTLLDACKPVPYMLILPTLHLLIGGIAPRSPQENANAAWAKLGLELGFDSMSVRPINGKGIEFFTAEVVEEENDT